jgi:hypothetical protein
MRAGVVCTLVMSGVMVSAASTGAFAQTVDPATVLAEARTAVGGDSRISGIKTFVATGRTRQVRGDNLVPIEFEIQIELPDKYSRRDEFPAQDAGPATSGFNGDRLVQIPEPLPPPARPGGPPPPTPEQQQAAARARLLQVKQDFARLMLGLLATSYPSFPLTFTYAGQAEAPQGKAHVLDAKGPANFTARLFISAETHLPIMVTWQQAAAGPRRGGPPPAGGPARGPAAPGAAAPPAAAPPGAAAPSPAAGAAPSGPGTAPPAMEHRLYFADYREVDGLKLPFRLRHAIGADTIEETTFDRFRINARTDPKRFEVSAQ